MPLTKQIASTEGLHSESIQAIVHDLPNRTRQGLTKIHKDADRRRWYLGAEADDERVDTALEAVR